MAKELFPNLTYDQIIGKTIDLGQENENGEAVKSVINGIVGSIQSQVGRANPIITPRVYFGQFNMFSTFSFTVNLPDGQSMNAQQIQTQITKQYPMLTNLQVTSLKDRWDEQTLSDRLSLLGCINNDRFNLILSSYRYCRLNSNDNQSKRNTS